MTATLFLLLAAAGARAQSTSMKDPNRGPGGPRNPLVVEGDRWYGRRQEGRNGSIASVGPINQAIANYDEAARAPDQVEARWKLARALYFKGAFTGLDADSRRAVFDKAKRASEEAIAILNKGLSGSIEGVQDAVRFGPEFLAGRLKDRSDAAPTYFWAAVAWGEWALARGKVDAAKSGAAETIRDYALTVIGLDPDFEEGGGYRILGRLNDQAPWIPFITGWVSEDEADLSMTEVPEKQSEGTGERTRGRGRAQGRGRGADTAMNSPAGLTQQETGGPA